MEGTKMAEGLTPEELAEAQRNYEVMKNAMDEDLWRIACLMAGKPDDQLLGRTEHEVRDLVLRMGAKAVETAVNGRKKKGYQGSSVVCGQCGADARFVEWREKTFVSLMGPIKVSSPYYHCHNGCGAGHRSFDPLLRLGMQRLTPAAEEVSAMAGILGSFADGAERVLRKMAGLRLSESTVERTTEAAGERVAKQLEAGESLGPTTQWKWQKDAAGRGCVYVSLDATGVRQQGPGGSPADGKMAYVAMVYNVNSEHDATRPPPRQVRYLSGFYDFQTLGRQLHREALEVGLTDAQQQIALSDGGNGLEDFFRTYFPKAERILDFWHATEHLVELGKSLHPHDELARQSWTDDVCHRLKHEGGPTVRAWLETLDLSSASAEVREVHRRETQFFRNHEHRMDYPRYVRNGWQIGSGPVESACKTVVGNRLKGGGMRGASQDRMLSATSAASI